MRFKKFLYDSMMFLFHVMRIATVFTAALTVVIVAGKGLMKYVVFIWNLLP